MGLYPHQRRKHTGHSRPSKDVATQQKPEGALVTFTEREQRLLDVLKEKEKLSLNQCCKLCRLNHKTTCELLADFIRFGLVELVFHGHKFYFKLNKE